MFVRAPSGSTATTSSTLPLRLADSSNPASDANWVSTACSNTPKSRPLPSSCKPSRKRARPLSVNGGGLVRFTPSRCLSPVSEIPPDPDRQPANARMPQILRVFCKLVPAKPHVSSLLRSQRQRRSFGFAGQQNLRCDSQQLVG